jgi:hypothetical protein
MPVLPTPGWIVEEAMRVLVAGPTRSGSVGAHCPHCEVAWAAGPPRPAPAELGSEGHPSLDRRRAAT